jgi:putative endonuclease
VASASSEGRSGWRLRPEQLIWKLGDAARQARQSKIMTPAAALGRRGEDLAHRYLEKLGLVVVARNYKPGEDSEVDIVARQGDTVVFVEVKSRASAAYGAPERAIDSDKQKHIIRAARAYLRRAGLEWTQARFDVVSVIFSNPPSIVHQRDAFFPERTI